jgi:uncharacterized protein
LEILPMQHSTDPYLISTLEQLEALFDRPGEASIKKEVSFVHPHYRALIEASPFAVLATCGPDGLDASPRGDPPGFVVVEDEKTLLLPERRGNNRVDSLRNIVTDPRVALLFLIPSITTSPSLLKRFSMDGKLPKCVVAVKVDTIYFQCARAIHRSKLWEPASTESSGKVPSPGEILATLTESQFDGEKYDRELPARQRATLY